MVKGKFVTTSESQKIMKMRLGKRNLALLVVNIVKSCLHYLMLPIVNRRSPKVINTTLCLPLFPLSSSGDRISQRRNVWSFRIFTLKLFRDKDTQNRLITVVIGTLSIINYLVIFIFTIRLTWVREGLGEG